MSKMAYKDVKKACIKPRFNKLTFLEQLKTG